MWSVTYAADALRWLLDRHTGLSGRAIPVGLADTLEPRKTDGTVGTVDIEDEATARWEVRATRIRGEGTPVLLQRATERLVLALSRHAGLPNTAAAFAAARPAVLAPLFLLLLFLLLCLAVLEIAPDKRREGKCARVSKPERPSPIGH
jgi:hypothetical protein